MNIESIVVGEFGVNAFLVSTNDGDAIVIDPGADADLIEARLRSAGHRVVAYLLTHGHVDHISAVAALCEKMPAPVAMHSNDLAWAFEANNRFPPFYDTPRRPPNVERILCEDQTWTDGGLTYRILETPGHSPGSVCISFEGEGVLFAGDTLFAGSVGRTDLPGGDPRVLNASLTRLHSLPDATRVYPGHGPETTIGYEKQTNFFMQNTAGSSR